MPPKMSTLGLIALFRAERAQLLQKIKSEDSNASPDSLNKVGELYSYITSLESGLGEKDLTAISLLNLEHYHPTTLAEQLKLKLAVLDLKINLLEASGQEAQASRAVDDYMSVKTKSEFYEAGSMELENEENMNQSNHSFGRRY